MINLKNTIIALSSILFVFMFNQTRQTIRSFLPNKLTFLVDSLSNFIGGVGVPIILYYIFRYLNIKVNQTTLLFICIFVVLWLVLEENVSILAASYTFDWGDIIASCIGAMLSYFSLKKMVLAKK